MTNNDDDDDYIDEDSLGDWRSFRMNLANNPAGVSEASTSSSSIDGIDLSSEDASSKTITSESATSSDTATTTSSSSSQRPKSVSKQNEQLLSAQNSALAEEYINGVWAHESSIPEVGGLVCRMPLESEIYRGSSDSVMHEKLTQFLASDEYDRTEDVTTRQQQQQKQQASSRISSSSTASQSMSFSALAAKTVFWYRGAQKLLKNEITKIMSNVNANGRIDPNDLDEESLELLQLYMDHQSTWQEVCLVTEMDNSDDGGGKKGGSKTITINRPMAFKLSKSMARLVLMGAYQAGEIDSPVSVTRTERDGGETQNLVKFLGAFENQCAVYVGGPNDMDKPAVLVHGIADLDGAVEISRGTGIYQGGLEAGECCCTLIICSNNVHSYRHFIQV